MRLRTLSAALGAACFLLLSVAKAHAADELQVALEVRLVSVSRQEKNLASLLPPDSCQHTCTPSLATVI